MAEDSTRKLLKVFGVAMTDCEDALTALGVALRDPWTPDAVVGALEAYDRASQDLAARWVEVSRLILDYQARAQHATEAHLRSRAR